MKYEKNGLNVPISLSVVVVVVVVVVLLLLLLLLAVGTRAFSLVVPCMCNGVEWSKDRTQAAESVKWRPQQAYGSNQVLLAQPQTIFSTPKILMLTRR